MCFRFQVPDPVCLSRIVHCFHKASQSTSDQVILEFGPRGLEMASKYDTTDPLYLWCEWPISPGFSGIKIVIGLEPFSKAIRNASASLLHIEISDDQTIMQLCSFRESPYSDKIKMIQTVQIGRADAEGTISIRPPIPPPHALVSINHDQTMLFKVLVEKLKSRYQTTDLQIRTDTLGELTLHTVSTTTNVKTKFGNLPVLGGSLESNAIVNMALKDLIRCLHCTFTPPQTMNLGVESAGLVVQVCWPPALITYFLSGRIL